MRSSTRLESVVFQLTPTRTRFDLVISANGKAERIASGLLKPFLAHLKSAQEQIDKGGYSIILETHCGSEASWFTKGTVERFVRFVSTPEILERVCTIESEISQIEEAISFQRNNAAELHAQVQDQVNYKESSEANSRKTNNHVDAGKSGSKSVMPTSEEKAIVLYKPDALAPETNGSNIQGENSKTQLLRVLETRKGVLQKEQGMAFARAVAAGFDIDHITPLITFAERFGAARMMEACSRFVELWKAKHESGLWVEAVEAMNSFASLNSTDKQKAFKEPWIQDEMPLENNDMKPQMDNHGPPHMQEHLMGQYQHHSMHPPWPVHPQAGQMPMYQPYPLPMQYYQNYPGNGTFFQPPYPSVDDSGMPYGQIVKQSDHSMENGEPNSESDMDEDSQSHQVRKKGGKGARKQSGTVVIRNINYIASKKQQSSDSGSQSSSGSEDVDGDDASKYGARNKNSRRSSKREGSRRRSGDAFKLLDKEENVSGHAADDGHWQAFQNLLLRNADDEDTSGKSSMFAMEARAKGRKQQDAFGNDPSIIGRQKIDGEVDNYHGISGDMIRTLKQSQDGMLTQRGVNLGQGTGSEDSHLDIQVAEMGGRTNGYRRTATGGDDLMIGRRDIPASASDTFVGDQFGYRNVHNRSSPHEVADESFIVPCRSSSLDQIGGGGRMSIDMDSELPLNRAGSENLTGKVGEKNSYESYDLNMMPDRVTENGNSYDPAMDYELQAAKVNGAKKSADVKKGTKKGDNVQGLKSQKKTTTVAKRGMPSKLSPAEEARARAEKLRSFKADLQKQKKAAEDEQKKRLEALKIERRKRIAARSSNGTSARSPLPSPPAKKPLPTKLSPVSQKGSKFSDTEPGSASPLQRSTVKTISRLSGDAHKTSRPGRLDFGNLSGGNRLTRSASPMSGQKEEKNGSTPDSKASMGRIRRLSEPKVSTYPASSITSPSEKSLPRRTSKGPEMKKTPAIVKSEITEVTALPESNTKESGVNKLSRSASTSSDRKEEKNVSSPDPKVPMARIRRLLEPKGSKDLASSITPPSEKPLSRRTSRGSEMKRTEITKDNTKESNALSDGTRRGSAIKEPTEKMNMEIKSSSSAGLIGGSTGVSSKNGYDEKIVVEKTVVTLECDKPSLVQVSEEKMHIHSRKPVLDPKKGKSSGNVAVHAQILPSNVREINERPVEQQLRKSSPSDKAGPACAEKVAPSISAINITEKPYNAPYARVSSLHDPCMDKSDYAKAPPASFDMATAGSELTTARVPSSMTVHVSDDKQHKLDKIWEVSEKPPEKESPKGFKRLLKFGRKKHGSGGESHLELDQANHDEASQDNTSNVASSSEAFTLKELISQREGSTTQTTPQKSSRSFSLLSPFRSKTSEKKLSTGT